MKISARALPGMYDVDFNVAVDHRGYLAKPFDDSPFRAAGIDVHWRQIITQFTERRNTVKGLHIQTDPFMEGKLVVPLAGEVLWISVDLRKNSPTFLRWEKTRLRPEDKRAVFVARGFAHGCLHLSDATQLLIAADSEHSDAHGVGIAWNDPEIGIDWPLIPGLPIVIKEEHRNNPPLSAVRRRLGL